MKITTPWSIQIELTQGCNRLCSFCGLNGVVEAIGKTPKFMTMETAEALVSQCMDYIPERRYEFAMHGEPTLNPNHLEILAMFREYLPKAQIQLTTNGYSLLRAVSGTLELRKIFDAGVDFIVLDTYKPERENLLVIANQSGYNIFTAGCEEKLTPYANHGRRIRDSIFIMDDLGEVSGQRKNRVIFNHAGNALSQPVPTEPLTAMCTNVFREMSVAYDGDVCGCCMDYGHEYICGNILGRTLKQIWEGPEFDALRRALYAKNRNFTPCARCNYPGGMRQGLIENPGPLEEDHKKIIRAIVKAASVFKKRNNLSTTIDI